MSGIETVREVISVDRRDFLSYIVVGGTGIIIVVVGFLADQGMIDLPGDQAISEEFRNNPGSLSFDADAGADIMIRVDPESDGNRRGEMTLSDPNGTEVIDTRFDTAGNTHESHTAEESGSYQLSVDPHGGTYRVTVSVNDPEE
ncbi:hypothetical protein [Natrarchaeobius chitinivorans]|uniref:hypothetical protein n=1 Tax=Natrarchaeobius chitinivorans TaxID=1679083 RepID=UPI000F527C83|nr:hypothetical protein [Natrarchaeobius chitinivorans]